MASSCRSGELFAVPTARQRRAQMHARNASLQRLRKITRIVGVGTAALTGIFAGLAAASNSGHRRHLLAQARPTRRSRPEASPNRIPAPPALPPLSGEGG